MTERRKDKKTVMKVYRKEEGLRTRHKLSRFFSFLFFCYSLFSSFSLYAQTIENVIDKPVAEIQVTYEGDYAKLSADDLRGMIRLREGNPYSAVEVRRSLLTLYESGRVANARCETAINANGSLVVTFLLQPQLRIGEVTFSDLVPEVTVEELRAKLTDLDRGLKFTPGILAQSADKIAAIFKDRGYYQASVESNTKPEANTTNLDVNFTITPGTPAKIASLNFTGNSKIPETLIRTNFKSKVGNTFLRSAFTADLQELLQQHLDKNYFAAHVGPADITYDSEKNAVNIQVPINAGPQLTIKTTGFALSEKRLRQTLPFMREGGIDDASLDDGALRIREYLQEEGYFFAEVTPPITPDLNGEQAELVYNIEPGQRYRVTDIRLEGTKNLSLIDVAPNLKTQTAAFLPIPLLTTRYIRGITSEQALRRDADYILTQLRDQGYRKARMAAINRAVSEDNDKLKIIFRVDEGPRSYIGDIAFKGNALFTTDLLRQKVQLKAGDAFSISQVKIEANDVLQYYFDKGYATASVLARTYEMGGEKVRVVYEITEGPLVYINRVFINTVGLRQRTVGGRVRNYVPFKDGDLLKNDQLLKSEQELYGVGAFRRVQVRTETLGEEGATGEARRNVFVDVEEGKSRVFVYGAGYQSDEGPRGIFEISDPNIFGRLTTAGIRLRASPRNYLGQLSYTDPRPFNKNTPLLFSLLAQQQKRPAFDSTRFTALLQVEKQLSGRSLLLFRYNYDGVSVRPPSIGNSKFIDPSDPLNQLDRRDQPIRLSRLSTSYAFDGRDNPFDATAGRYHTADVTVALRAFGGNGQFFRFFTENQAYFKLPSKTGGAVLATNLRVGLAANIGTPLASILPRNPTAQDFKLIPLTERFFTGGSTTLRGFNFELAGPRNCLLVVPDPNDATKKVIQDCQNTATKAGSNPIFQLAGGNALIIGNAEIRQPVYRQISLVGFYDVGNVFRTINSIRFPDFTHSVGLGVRIKTPLGPLRFDMGYLASDPYAGTGLNKSCGGQSCYPDFKVPRVRFHISFGQAF